MTQVTQPIGWIPIDLRATAIGHFGGLLQNLTENNLSYLTTLSEHNTIQSNPK
jgi:hypothetical protein